MTGAELGPTVGSVSLGEAIFINISMSLVTELMPGGVAEAGTAAGLTAVGVDQDVVVVLVHRIVGNDLPLMWGDASFRWLTTHDCA